jgi:hypothetical protein
MAKMERSEREIIAQKEGNPLTNRKERGKDVL